MSAPKQKPPAAAPPARKTPTDYFKVYAPKLYRRELHMEALMADKSLAQYTREIIDERLPHELRMVLRERAERDGTTVQKILLEGLVAVGISEAKPLLAETKKKRP
ncbi:hypothetical protein [Polyangium sp. y55x31]|uniref:hypothetical protein n=1 Tax=Polyangium sp. y55x31 TaxID=3042688 RepID=UPI0024823067|nr:hypothetical protein [Polyangium sp. y55x31]MDI1483575.1 hypothetical protein [Polyangium sp. y55x31]